MLPTLHALCKLLLILFDECFLYGFYVRSLVLVYPQARKVVVHAQLFLLLQYLAGLDSMHHFSSPIQRS